MGDRDELVLQLVDFFLDLALVDALFSSGNDLCLDFRDDVDGAVHGGVGRVDLGGAEAESVGNGREGLVVRPHGRCDGPVCSVVSGLIDTIARGDAALGVLEGIAYAAQGLQRCHGSVVGDDACHVPFFRNQCERGHPDESGNGDASCKTRDRRVIAVNEWLRPT